MAIPITIEKLLTENVVEWARIEFKEGFNAKSSVWWFFTQAMVIDMVKSLQIVNMWL